jgi:hypothetical protein
MRRATLTACAVAALTWGLSGIASAQRLDAPVTRDVYFTFSESVVVPGQTLPAGKYLFRVIGDGRNIVQIYSGDRARLIHTAMAVGAMRRDQPERPEIRLIESSAATPVAVGTWWYPEMRQGWEFVYPRAQAVTMAKTAKQPILTTAESVTPEKAGEGELVRLDPSGSQSAFDADADRPMTGAARVGETAVADADASNSAAARQSAQAPAPMNQQADANTARTTLPRTAGSLPTIALAGVVSLLAGFALAFRRRAA